MRRSNDKQIYLYEDNWIILNMIPTWYEKRDDYSVFVFDLDVELFSYYIVEGVKIILKSANGTNISISNMMIRGYTVDDMCHNDCSCTRKYHRKMYFFVKQFKRRQKQEWNIVEYYYGSVSKLLSFFC